MAREQLDVWLYGTLIARLSEPSRFRYRLDFTAEGISRFGSGSRVLSLGIPLSPKSLTDEPFGQQPVSAFLEGLLPEGNVRSQIATSLRVPVTDKMGLLRGVGAECAGAVQFLQPGRIPGEGNVLPLTAAEVELMVASMPTYHLPEGMAPQASLAGIQDKILLTATADGWGWPTRGAMSTHIIKPEPISGPGALDGLVEGENWALAVARQAGLKAAQSRIEEFGERKALVVARYDRANGVRLHQEDFCQALGLDPQAKYESLAECADQGSRLARVAGAASARAADPSRLRQKLLQAVTFNVAIGNGDAHSKNYSLLLLDTGEVDLAPLYDTAPVMYLDPRFSGAGHIINGRSNLNSVGVEDLTAAGVAIGLPEQQARRIVDETLSRTLEAARVIDPPRHLGQIADAMERTFASRSWPTATLPEQAGSDHSPANRERHIWVPEHKRSGAKVRGHWRTR